tara:strand:+ start:793 stop:1137 length:345 start_codon:yes stop_codon:yes gene_type:complete
MATIVVVIAMFTSIINKPKGKSKMDKDTKLKELYALQKLLKFEISQTRRAKRLAKIEKAIEEKVSPAKERAKNIAAQTGKDAGRFKIGSELAAWSVAIKNVRAHERVTVRFTLV